MIYIATWGNPLDWKRANYICEDDKKESEGYFGLLCYIGKEVNKIILIVLDSILTPLKTNENKNSLFYECIKDINISEIKSYKEWKDKIHEYVQCILKKSGINIDFDLIVIPAIGKIGEYTYGLFYKNKEEVTYLSSEHIKVFLIYELYKKLKNIKENENIILDVTHGINYIGALTALELIKLADLLKYRLNIINFVPIVPRSVFSERKVYSYNPIQIGSYEFLYTSINEKNIKKKTKRSYIINAIKNNSILLLTYFDDYKLENIEYNPEIDHENKRIILKNFPEISYEDDAWADIISDYIINKVMSKYNYKRTKEDLEKISQEIYGKNSKSHFFISHELNRIYNTVKNVQKKREYIEYLNKGIMYKDLMEISEKIENNNSDKNSNDISNKIKEDKKQEGDIKIYRRNIIAHAGLLKEFTFIKLENEKIKLYYKLDDKYKKIFEDIFGEGILNFIKD